MRPTGQLRDVWSCLVTGSFLPLTPLLTSQFPSHFFSAPIFAHPQTPPPHLKCLNEMIP